MTKIRVLILTVLTSLTLVTTVTSQTTKINQARPNTTLVTPTVTLSSSTTTISEAGGTSTITATLSQATDKPVLVDFSVGGTAKNTADYKTNFSHYGLPAISAGGNGDGSGANQLSGPNGIFIDKQKNLYVADVFNNRIQKWSYGATTGQTIATASGSPVAVFVDSLGNMYVVERYNHRVQKWTPGASVGVTVAGGNGQGSSANQLTYPQSVYVDK